MPTTFEKTWQTDINRAPSDNSTVLGLSRSYLWYVKAFLKGEVGGATSGLWTCVGSSDSVTAGMDNIDRWGATYDGTKIVRANGAVAHSWIVLKSPNFTAGGIVGVPFYMTIQYNGTLDYQAIFVFSKALPTGGSVTARPTATDEWAHTAAQGQLNDITFAAYKFNGWLATDGNFAFGSAKQTTGLMYAAMMFHVLSNANATDLYPACSYLSYTVSGLGGFGLVPSIRGRTYDGTATYIAGAFAYPRSSTDPTTSFSTSFGDATILKFLRMPTWLQVTDAGMQSFRGRFADLVIAVPSAAALQGFVEPASGAPVSEMLGNFWFPVNGVAVTL